MAPFPRSTHPIVDAHAALANPVRPRRADRARRRRSADHRAVCERRHRPHGEPGDRSQLFGARRHDREQHQPERARSERRALARYVDRRVPARHRPATGHDRGGQRHDAAGPERPDDGLRRRGEPAGRVHPDQSGPRRPDAHPRCLRCDGEGPARTLGSAGPRRAGQPERRVHLPDGLDADHQ